MSLPKSACCNRLSAANIPSVLGTTLCFTAAVILHSTFLRRALHSCTYHITTCCRPCFLAGFFMCYQLLALFTALLLMTTLFRRDCSLLSNSILLPCLIITTSCRLSRRLPFHGIFSYKGSFAAALALSTFLLSLQACNVVSIKLNKYVVGQS